MTKQNSIVRVFAIFVLICNGLFVSIAQENPADKFAFEQNKRLGRGVNIIGYDAIWTDASKARMTEKHFKLLKKAGFDNVRIVIMPFKFSMKDADFTIDPKFYVTLDWAINQALKNNLIAIVDFGNKFIFYKAFTSHPIQRYVTARLR